MTTHLDFSKKYLLLVTTPEAMSMQDIEDANAAIQRHFPNMSIVSLKPGTKFKLVERDSETKA